MVLNDQHINLCYLLPLLVERALFISRSINISWTLVRYEGQCLHGDIFPWIVHCIMSLHKLGHCVDSRFVVFFRIQHGYNSGGRWVGTSGPLHISTKKTLDFRSDAFQGYVNIISESKSSFYTHSYFSVDNPIYHSFKNTWFILLHQVIALLTNAA